MRGSSGSSASAPSSMTTTCLHASRARQVLREQRQQRPVDEHDLVLGVVDRVDQLLGEVADVERVHHPSGAGDREVQREVAGGVPREGADPAVGGDVERVERGRDAAGVVAHVGERAALEAGAVLVTIVLPPKYWPPRSKIQLVVSGTSCMSPCMCKRLHDRRRVGKRSPVQKPRVIQVGVGLHRTCRRGSRPRCR